MGTKKSNKLYAAAAALAVTASAVAPGLTADAASKVTVKSVTNPASISHYGGYTFAVKKLSLPKTVKVLLSNKKYENRSVKWGKVSYDKKYIGKYQTISGTVSGTTKKASIKVKLNNYPVDVVEPKLAPVAVGEKLNLPSTIDVKYKDGKVIARSAKSFNLTAEKTDKAGEMKLSYNYMGKNSSIKGSIAYEVKAAEITNVMDSVKEDTLSVSADVKFPAKDAKAQLLIFAGKDESKGLDPVEGKIENGKFTAEAKMIPDGTHSYKIKVGDVVSTAKEFKVDNAVKVEDVTANNLREVKVTFNKAIDAKSLTSSTVKLNNGTSNQTLVDAYTSTANEFKANLSSDGKTLSLLLDAAVVQGTEVTVTIDKVKDISGKEVAQTTKKAVALDTLRPEVGNVEVLAKNQLKVWFSETLQTQPTIQLDGGTVGTAVTFNAGDNFAIVNTGTIAAGEHTITVNGGTDYANLPVAKTDVKFNYQIPSAAPVATLVSTTASTATIKFDRAVTNVSPSFFTHTFKGDTTTDAIQVIALSDKEYRLVFDKPFPAGSTPLYLAYPTGTTETNKIKDNFGNIVGETQFTINTVSDVVKPTVEKVEYDAKTNKVTVAFSELVDETTAETSANYVVRDEDNKVVLGSTPVLAQDGKTIEFTPNDSLKQGNYTLAIKSVKDTAGNTLDAVTKTITVADTTAPALTKAIEVKSKTVRIYFNEAIDASDIINLSLYKLDNKSFPTGTTISKLSDKVVEITLPTTSDDIITSGTSSIAVSGDLKDVAGNKIGGFASAPVTVQADTASAVVVSDITDAKFTAQNKFEFTVKQRLSSVDATKFVINGNAQTATSTSFMVNPDGTTTVKVELPALQKVNTGLSNLADIDFLSGAFTNEFGVLSAAINNYDLTKVADKINAEISTVAFADNDANGQIDRAVLTLTEAVEIESVQASDFTVDGYVVKKVVSVTSAGVVTLELAENGIADTDNKAKVTQVGSLTDKAGNAGIGVNAVIAAADVIDNAAPALISSNLSTTDKVLTLTFSENIANNTLDATTLKAAVTKGTDGATFSALAGADTVTIVGNKLVINFDTALTSNTTDVKVAPNTLKDNASTANVLSTPTIISNIDTAAN